jgi:hypothetical protein
MKIVDFVNEIGNRIKIKVQAWNDSGVNHKTKQKIKFKGVKISMVDPTSISENEITLEEARRLYITLGEFLSEI